jgi:hypothetical protein
MSLTEILAEVDRLSAADRAELTRRLRARELVEDPQRTADVSARLDRALRGEGVVSEDELHRRLSNQKQKSN